MSTLKADTVTTKSDDTDLTITGGGTGVPNLEAGFKVGGSAGVPTASIQDDAVTLAKMAAGTDGNLITYDASGDPAHVATGTATHVLTSNGAGAAPTFQAAAGGGRIFLGSFTPSGGSVTITGISSTYDHHIIDVEMASVTAAGADATMVLSTDAGVSFVTTGYYFVRVAWNLDSGGGASASTNAANIGIASSIGDASGEHWSGSINLWGFPGSGIKSHVDGFGGTSYIGDSTNGKTAWVHGYQNVAATHDACKISATGLGGTFRLYGVVKS